MKLDNKNIFCSVSAGYSSVMMAIKIREWFPDHNIINVMANTSKERLESLEFMNQCDKYYGLNLKWIEADFEHGGKGVKPRLVSYEDLKINGEIFEQGIKKLGIPHAKNKWCNRDMKLRAMKKYVDSVFGKKNYSIAVGIRADEVDRVTKDYKDNNVFYPLLDKGITSEDRNKFWSKQPIKIKIPAFKGNCDLCFQKSNRKIMTILSEDPETGKWWSEMINKYGKIEIDGKKSYNDIMKVKGTATFYRGLNTIEDLVKMSQEPFSKATDEYIYENDLFDKEDECGSGCQVF